MLVQSRSFAEARCSALYLPFLVLLFFFKMKRLFREARARSSFASFYSNVVCFLFSPCFVADAAWFLRILPNSIYICSVPLFLYPSYFNRFFRYPCISTTNFFLCVHFCLKHSVILVVALPYFFLTVQILDPLQYAGRQASSGWVRVHSHLPLSAPLLLKFLVVFTCGVFCLAPLDYWFMIMYWVCLCIV